MTIDWKGREVQSRVERATVTASNIVLDRATRAAKSSHPGWRNVTGRAEASIRAKRAEPRGSEVNGALYSDVDYFIFLEIGSYGRTGDATLRRAGDAEFHKLAEEIRRNLK